MQCAGFNHLLKAGKVCGIYKITSSLFNIYIGQSVDIGRRINEHKACRNSNKNLSGSILKFGWNTHVVEILEVCDKSQLNDREKHYVDLYKSFSTVHGLNSTKGGRSRPIMTEETKRKIGEKSKGRKLSAKHIQGIKDRNTGRVVSEEQKKRISDTLKGRVFSDDHKKKIGAKHKGRKHSDEFRQAVSERRKGKKLTDEQRAEWSKNRMGEKNNFFGKKHSEEAKRKMREARVLRKPKNKDNHG